MGLFSNLRKVWNIFSGSSTTKAYIPEVVNRVNYNDIGSVSYSRPDRIIISRKSEHTFAVPIFNRIANVCASMDIRHVKVDKNGVYQEDINSTLNECLSLNANLDQTGRMLIRDAVMSMCDEGQVAIVPVDYDDDPLDSESYSILSLRTGKIVAYYPDKVDVEIYNEKDGNKYTITVEKSKVAIIENPLYAIMNEPNSTLQSLVRKRALLDLVDEAQGAGKIDLIVQLPYAVKSTTKKDEAARRRTELEDQLRNSKYGIAYTDATEKITQLNRPVENNVLKSVEYLTRMLYSQLGMTDKVLDGTADEQTMLNFIDTTIKPFMDAITEEMKRKFLSKTARSQGQSIQYFSNPFKIVPVEKIAEIADKFTRNEIMSSNEIRRIIGLRPVDDPRADELRNKNLNEPEDKKPVMAREENQDLPLVNSSTNEGKSKEKE